MARFASLVLTPMPTPQVRSRSDAIRFARSSARSFSEPNPVLIDAALLPYAQAIRRVRAADTPPGDGHDAAGAGWTEDKLVWVVRMRGDSFRPPMGPNAETAPPLRGWMFVLLDTKTGWPMFEGYHPASVPIP